jgi:hypothetical protein
MHTRVRRIGSAVAAGLALAGMVVSAGSAHAATPTVKLKPLHGILQPVSRLFAAKNDAAEATLNWAGYAVPAATGEHITSIQATWIVPKLKLLPPGYSSTWVGIGGLTTTDLIQAGTESSFTEGNYAWIEVLPANEVKLTNCSGDSTCAVAVGDRIHVGINNTGGDGWAISVSDGSKWSYSTTTSYHSTLSSADYVFEAPGRGIGVAIPTLLPASTDHQQFLGGSSYTVNGATRTIENSPTRVRITMSPIGLDPVDVAIPSTINPDGSFNVCSYKLSCKAP